MGNKGGGTAPGLRLKDVTIVHLQLVYTKYNKKKYKIQKDRECRTAHGLKQKHVTIVQLLYKYHKYHIQNATTKITNTMGDRESRTAPGLRLKDVTTCETKYQM